MFFPLRFRKRQEVRQIAWDHYMIEMRRDNPNIESVKEKVEIELKSIFTTILIAIAVRLAIRLIEHWWNNRPNYPSPEYQSTEPGYGFTSSDFLFSSPVPGDIDMWLLLKNAICFLACLLCRCCEDYCPDGICPEEKLEELRQVTDEFQDSTPEVSLTQPQNIQIDFTQLHATIDAVIVLIRQLKLLFGK